MKIGIYKIINKINGKFYIGSSKDLSRRKKDHFRLLKQGKNKCLILQNAVNKYGIENFTFEIVAKCPLEYQFQLEQWFVDNLKPQYNACLINVSVPIGLNGAETKDLEKYSKNAKERLKVNPNFGWKSKTIIKIDEKGNELKEYTSLTSYAEEHNCAVGNVGKALKKGNKCKGYYIKYKD